jgi:hypothetical protein
MRHFGTILAPYATIIPDESVIHAAALPLATRALNLSKSPLACSRRNEGNEGR